MMFFGCRAPCALQRHVPRAPVARTIRKQYTNQKQIKSNANRITCKCGRPGSPVPYAADVRQASPAAACRLRGNHPLQQSPFQNRKRAIASGCHTRTTCNCVIYGTFSDKTQLVHAVQLRTSPLSFLCMERERGHTWWWNTSDAIASLSASRAKARPACCRFPSAIPLKHGQHGTEPSRSSEQKQKHQNAPFRTVSRNRDGDLCSINCFACVGRESTIRMPAMIMTLKTTWAQDTEPMLASCCHLRALLQLDSHTLLLGPGAGDPPPAAQLSDITENNFVACVPVRARAYHLSPRGPLCRVKVRARAVAHTATEKAHLACAPESVLSALHGHARPFNASREALLRLASNSAGQEPTLIHLPPRPVGAVSSFRSPV